MRVWVITVTCRTRGRTVEKNSGRGTVSDDLIYTVTDARYNQFVRKKSHRVRMDRVRNRNIGKKIERISLSAGAFDVYFCVYRQR